MSQLSRENVGFKNRKHYGRFLRFTTGKAVCPSQLSRWVVVMMALVGTYGIQKCPLLYEEEEEFDTCGS
jgi:hypothetical protein